MNRFEWEILKHVWKNGDVPMEEAVFTWDPIAGGVSQYRVKGSGLPFARAGVLLHVLSLPAVWIAEARKSSREKRYRRRINYRAWKEASHQGAK